MQENNTVSLFNINISCGSQQDAEVSACTNILGEILAPELSVIKLTDFRKAKTSSFVFKLNLQL